MMEPSGTGTPGGASPGLEFITPIGYSKSSHCGYCNSSGQSYSYMVTAASLSPGFYQTLLDRSWRRSGTLLYRTNPRISCCPHYTIRLDSHEFKPSRDQRSTINRFNKFITGDAYTNEAARLYPRSRQEVKDRNNEFQFPERVHEAEHSRVKTPPEPAHKFVVTLEDNSFTDEKWRVYDNYQMVVHKDPPSKRRPHSFKGFLCSSPLRHGTMTGADGRKRRLGSFHQCYRVDGELVAVGVLDLLPDCVSSVYFFYHESFHKYRPGKLGALHEIALALEEGYRWWYPGFYIHSCAKMRYKMEYSPQHILDPETLTWDRLDKDVLRLLDRSKYVSLSEERRRTSAEAGNGVMEQTNHSAIQGHNEQSEGDDEDVDVPGNSLFTANMPGIPSISEMEHVNLDHVALKAFPKGPLVMTSNLRDWKADSIRAWPGIKPAVAEMVAALGLDSVDKLCVDLTSS